MRKLKQEKAITLIALVITIIVLLILAGVSIAILTGDNGILNQAEKAKEETKIATEEEQRQLAMAEAATNLEDTKYQGITIPAGMAPTRIEGENTVKEGLVAIDKNGNEWVWIEVPKSIYTDPNYQEEQLEVNDVSDYVGIEKVLKKYTSSYSLDGRKDVFLEGCGLTKAQYEEKYRQVLESIYINEGFWIGRYEAGIEGSQGVDEKSLALVRSATNKEDVEKKAISQKDAIPYNFVNVRNAQKLASEMTPGNTRTSSLMFGIQWDLICKFLEVNSDLKFEDIASDSRNWGNYSGRALEIDSKFAKRVPTLGKAKPTYGMVPGGVAFFSTGASNKFKKLNIYDLSGNAFEITLQTLHDNYGVDYFSTRGGMVNEDENKISAGGYSGIPPEESSWSRTFRPSLY